MDFIMWIQLLIKYWSTKGWTPASIVFVDRIIVPFHWKLWSQTVHTFYTKRFIIYHVFVGGCNVEENVFIPQSLAVVDFKILNDLLYLSFPTSGVAGLLIRWTSCQDPVKNQCFWQSCCFHSTQLQYRNKKLTGINTQSKETSHTESGQPWCTQQWNTQASAFNVNIPFVYL